MYTGGGRLTKGDPTCVAKRKLSSVLGEIFLVVQLLGVIHSLVKTNKLYNHAP